MTDYVRELRTIIDNGPAATDHQAYVTNLVMRIPAGRVGSVLYEATRDIAPYPLGYTLVALLNDRLSRDDELFEELSRYLTLTAPQTAFRTVLLDILNGHSQGRETRRQLLQRSLQEIATSARQPVGIRAIALRALKLSPTDESTTLLHTLLKRASPTLIDAVADVVATWLSEGHTAPASIETTLVEYAQTAPSRALRSSGVMAALASLKTPLASRTLHHLVKGIRTPEERTSLLSAAGSQLDTDLLAQLTRQVMDTHDYESARLLRATFVDNPKQLADLHASRHVAEYLYGLTLVPDLVDAAEAKRLLDLRRGPDEALRNLAQRAIMLAPAHAELVPLQSKVGQLHAGIATMKTADAVELVNVFDQLQNLLESLFPSDPGKVENGYSTGYHKADAIYRDLGDIQYAGTQNHWHAFLYQGFEVLAGTGLGRMIAVQNDGGKMRFDMAQLDFPAGSSVRQKMQELQTNFHSLLQQAGWLSPFPLHGGRRTPGITAEIAEKIVGTGDQMGNKGTGISYTFMNMLKHKGNAWNGTVNDIHSVRCDGVVEFCYEKNGQRVCGGINSNRWNIAQPNTNRLDNHNSFHTWAYNDGELCPRIQAGDKSDPNDWHSAAPNSATRMSVDEGPELPKVAKFYVTPRWFLFPPIIGFNIEANRYNHVYVRLTVSRDGGPFHVVLTENSEYAGAWRFEKVHTDRDIAGFWQGKTLNGPDHAHQDGPFEFRLVAVDLAGNVSELRRVTVAQVWP
jgi:hypothetical protein